MATQAILGLFDDANAAADAGDALKSAGIPESDYHFLTDVPYPEGAFGERMEKHRLYLWPLIGGAIGLIVSLVVAGVTPLAVPMFTTEMPILAMPPLSVICYTGTILGGILFTVIGVAMSVRPNFRVGHTDDRISQGLIGVLVNAGAEQGPRVTEILNEAGAVDVSAGRG